MIQVECQLVRVPAPAFQSLMRRSPELSRLVGRFIEALFQLVAQNSACNRLHITSERLSRWLLMTQDRVESNELLLTHEFAGQMLGVRRQSVTEAAGALQARGLIDYRRGNVMILDRAALEAAACECYEVIRIAFADMYD